MDKQQTKSRPTAALVSAMLIFGTIGIFRRWIPLPSGLIACIRGGVGALVLWLWQRLRGKKLTLPAWKNGGLTAVLSGVFLAANWILLFEAYRFTTVAAATLCYYTAPVWIILLSAPLLGERLTAKKLLCCAGALAGMLLLNSGAQSAPVRGTQTAGLLLGLGAAVLYAGVVVLNKKMPQVDDAERTIMQLAAAAAVLLPYTLLAERGAEAQWSLPTAGLLLLVGILHTGIAYALYFGALPRISAQTAAVLSYIDPLTAMVLGALVLHEAVGGAEIIGAILILGAAMISELPLPGKAKK